MKPPAFEYASPRSLDDALALLRRHDGDAKLLAGGQSLVPLLAMRLARPTLLVDLGRIEGLDTIREESGWLAIGAMATKSAVERSALVRTKQPLLHEATLRIGHPQIRNRGTVGGSLAHADPAAEYPAAALALGAKLQVVGEEGERSIDAADFFVAPLVTALGTCDILTGVRVPVLAPRTGWSLVEVARRHGDFAMAGAAVTVSTGGGRITAARIVLFGVGGVPIRAARAEQVLIGQSPAAAAYRAAAAEARSAVESPLSDVHASAEYRRHLAGVLVERALAEAAERAGGTQ